MCVCVFGRFGDCRHESQDQSQGMVDCPDVSNLWRFGGRISWMEIDINTWMMDGCCIKSMVYIGQE